MNRSLIFSFLVLLGFSGCASLESGNTEQLLSAAGFRTRTPVTAKQVEIFKTLPPYRVERRMIQGKVVYTYANPRKNLLYIGGEAEYQQFRRLGLQQQISMNNLAAAQINQSNMMMLDGWGPWGLWW